MTNFDMEGEIVVRPNRASYVSIKVRFFIARPLSEGMINIYRQGIKFLCSMAKFHMKGEKL